MSPACSPPPILQRRVQPSQCLATEESVAGVGVLRVERQQALQASRVAAAVVRLRRRTARASPRSSHFSGHSISCRTCPAPPGTLSYRTTPHSLPSCPVGTASSAHLRRVQPQHPASAAQQGVAQRLHQGGVCRVVPRKPNSASSASVTCLRSQHLEAMHRRALLLLLPARVPRVIVAKRGMRVEAAAAAFPVP